MTLFPTVLLYSLLSQNVLHPFHASVCEIEYNSEGQSLEITYKMFIDDLETALAQRFKTQLDITATDQKEKVDHLVEEYLAEQFEFWINDDKVKLEFLGSEIEEYALWCFIEITDVTELESLKVDNKVMLELFDDQVNIVHFNKEDQVRSLKLFKNKSFGALDLKELFD